MAGGGYGRGAGIPLKDRVRVDDADPGSSRPTAGPGLLLDWRWAGHLWEGRVVYVAQLRPSRWATVEEWIPAELLTSE